MHSRVINHHPSPRRIDSIGGWRRPSVIIHPSIIHPSASSSSSRGRTYLDEIIVIVHDDGRGGGGARLLRLTRSH